MNLNKLIDAHECKNRIWETLIYLYLYLYLQKTGENRTPFDGAGRSLKLWLGTYIWMDH